MRDLLGMSLTSHSDARAGGRSSTVVSTDGTPIAVWRSGDGPPLVLVHGATADHTRWAPVMAALRGALHRPRYRPPRPRPQRRCDLLRDRTRVRGRRHGRRVGRRLGQRAGALVRRHVRARGGAAHRTASARLVLYEAPVGFLQTPPHVVHRLQALLDADERDELLVLLHAGSRRPVLRADRPACGRCRPGRRDSPRPTRSPARSLRIGNTSSTPDRFRALHAPTLLLAGGDSPDAFRAAGRGTVRGPARRQGRGHARAATRRDGHRDRAVRRRGPRLPRARVIP